MMQCLLRSPLVRLLWLFGALLFFVMVTAPASLIDRGLRHATDERLRLTETRGTIWRGEGLMAERAASRHHPWIHVAWNIETGQLWRGRLGASISIDGQAALQLQAWPSGFSLEMPGSGLPLAPLLRTLPHPAARLGWNGRLQASGQFEHCNWALACTGRMQIQVNELALSVLPNARLGQYQVDVTGADQTLVLDLASPQSNRLTAHGKVTLKPPRSSQGDITLDGERHFIRQISAMTADIAKMTPEGTLRLSW